MRVAGYRLGSSKESSGYSDVSAKATPPILLIVEDLHWADRSTLDLLAYLARNFRDERVFTIATFRSDELHRRHPLTAWLAESERQMQSERFDLARFDRAGVVELLTTITPGCPRRRSTADSIADRSDGNPFFVEGWWRPSRIEDKCAGGCRGRCVAC